jgi:hypothetical protein
MIQVGSLLKWPLNCVFGFHTDRNTFFCFCFLYHKGLGKTITVLALILQTHSLDTPSQCDSSVAGDDTNKTNNSFSLIQSDDAVIFEVYWRESIVAEFQRPLLFKFLNRLHKQNRFLCFQSIQKSISSDKFAEDFSAFEKDVL